MVSDLVILSLRGYFTKYDCSSADINPIGGLSKSALSKFVCYMRQKYDLEILDELIFLLTLDLLLQHHLQN